MHRLVIDSKNSNSHNSISSETKTLSTSSNNLCNENDDSENENLRSSTACLVSLDAISHRDEISQSSNENEHLSSNTNHSQSLSCPVPKERTSLIGVLKSRKDFNENEVEGSTTSSISPKSSTSGRRSGANLTVTFDFDYEDRSIGKEISDTPRSHIFKDVPDFIQKKLFGSVRGLGKRLGGQKQQPRTEKEVSENQNKSNLPNSELKVKTGADVIRKKPMAPQPPSLVNSQSDPAV